MLKEIFKIKNKILLSKKWITQDIFFLKQHVGSVWKKNRIILFDTADHSNLGDHAIAVAEKQFIIKYLPEFSIIEVPGGNILRHTSLYRKFIKDTDIITIAGGGFLGDLWPFEEKIVQTIMKEFDKNNLVIFPQTFFVDECKVEEYKQEHKGYIKHKHLIICLRDKESCDRFKKVFPEYEGDVIYMPDLVCGLEVEIKNKKRENVGICFRQDIESTDVVKDRNEIERILAMHSLQCVDIDTIDSRNIHPREREERVYKKINEFAEKKLVITDRLHAMLFAAITNTPCIAFDNKSGKVKGVYEWISNQKYIIFTESLIDFEKNMELIDFEKEYKYDARYVESYYKELSCIVKDKLK